jgi:ATP-dependent Clp protease protease subunit
MKHRQLFQLLRANARQRDDGKPSIRSEVTNTEAHVYIYDVIDAWWGANATDLITALAAAGEREVHAHINSPGGDVFEGRAMAAALAAHPGNVITHIDGLAASAATYVALAGSEVRITRGGMVMIHEGWTMGWGNKRELGKTVDLLDKVDRQIAADYAAKTGLPLDEVLKLMEAETWYTEDEALAAKLVDVIDTNTKRADGTNDTETASNRVADWNLSAFRNAPKFEKRKKTSDEADLNAAVAAQLQANRNRLRLLTAH